MLSSACYFGAHTDSFNLEVQLCATSTILLGRQMLALNSYGLHGGTASPSRGNNNNGGNGFVTLPRISGGGFPAARSLGKADLMAARRGEHPLYRTTTGFDYGRYLDIDGGSGALSCPKHAKVAGFTREFIAGSYVDTSLQSIDKRWPIMHASGMLSTSLMWLRGQQVAGRGLAAKSSRAHQTNAAQARRAPAGLSIAAV